MAEVQKTITEQPIYDTTVFRLKAPEAGTVETVKCWLRAAEPVAFNLQFLCGGVVIATEELEFTEADEEQIVEPMLNRAVEEFEPFQVKITNSEHQNTYLKSISIYFEVT